MKNYLISEELLNNLLNYLGRKPFVEVAQLIGQMGQLKEVPPIPLSIVPKESGEK